MNRFVKLVRLEDSELLQYMIQRDHNAFILLTLIAQRARRVRDPHPATGRRQYEAEIGDYVVCGMSERNYRTAKEHLEKWNLATFKPTSKGTIATLINGRIFDINPEEADGQVDRQPTDRQRTSDRQPTTKKNEKNVTNDNNGIHPLSGKQAGAIHSRCGSYASDVLRVIRLRPEFHCLFGGAEQVAKSLADHANNPDAKQNLEDFLLDMQADPKPPCKPAAIIRKLKNYLNNQRRTTNHESNQGKINGTTKHRNTKRTASKADSVGRASGGGLPEL